MYAHLHICLPVCLKPICIFRIMKLILCIQNKNYNIFISFEALIIPTLTMYFALPTKCNSYPKCVNISFASCIIYPHRFSTEPFWVFYVYHNNTCKYNDSFISLSPIYTCYLFFLSYGRGYIVTLASLFLTLKEML